MIILSFRAPIDQEDGCLTARSREDSKLRDSGLDIANRYKIWQATVLLRCREISERYDHYNIQSHGFESSWYFGFICE